MLIKEPVLIQAMSWACVRVEIAHSPHISDIAYKVLKDSSTRVG